MTALRWAVICTIQQCPSYIFTGPERSLAEGMVHRGLLRPHATHPGQYEVTAAGLIEYRQKSKSGVSQNTPK